MRLVRPDHELKIGPGYPERLVQHVARALFNHQMIAALLLLTAADLLLRRIGRQGDLAGKRHRQPLQILHGADLSVLRDLVEQLPEEISLADGADIFTGPGDHGNGRVAVITHFLKTLAEGTVLVEIRDAIFGEQKISNVHFVASFLMRQSRPYGGGASLLLLLLLYKKPLEVW